MFPNDNDFEAQFTFETESNPLAEEPPFYALMLGDWSGDAIKKDLSERRPIFIDRDNFDDVIKKLNVSLKLDLNGDGNTLTLQFNELDDFHPDNLFRQVSLFTDLRDLRRRLLNNDSFNEAARQVRAWFNVSDDNEDTLDSHMITENLKPVDSENLLDQILAQPNDNPSVKNKKIDNSDLGRFLSKIVTPFLVNVDENEQSKLISAVDDATGALMRKILHHSDFQALESAWRGLYFVIRRIETDSDLKIFLLDISKPELSANLKSVNSLADSFLFRTLFSETVDSVGAESYALMCGNYTFGVNVEDIAILMRIAQIAKASVTPFISNIRPEMFGLKSFSELNDLSNFKFSDESIEGKLWSTLRALPESDSLGLLPMRFLVRMPYGELTDPIEAFSFEEFTEEQDHQIYLWSNPGFVCCLLLMQSFRLQGWEMEKKLCREIEDLPMHIYRENHHTKTKPCSEIVLTENLADRILLQGLMPLISFRDADRVLLQRFQSVSMPLKKLNAKWNVLI